MNALPSARSDPKLRASTAPDLVDHGLRVAG